MSIFKKGTIEPKAPMLPPAEKTPDEWAYWMPSIKALIGTKEIPGKAANAKIVEFLKTCVLAIKYQLTDSTAWCSAFFNWVMKKHGLKRTNSAAAISWFRVGIELEEPCYGCGFVESYGDGHGHVSFFSSWKIVRDVATILGGNQSDMVCYTNWTMYRISGGKKIAKNIRFFWPEGAPLPPYAKVKPKQIGSL